MSENDKQAKPVAMKYYDEHGNDKLEGLLINNSKHVSTISCFDKDDTEVLRIEQDGDVIWKGRKVESDAEFKAAMIDLANVMKSNMHPAQPVQPVESVAHYGIIDPDYARVFTQARCIAWQYGYACVMQGSFTRDLDLLMVPWTEQAKDNREQLLKLIAMACDLRFSDGKEDVIQSKLDFTQQPHGRTSCSLHFPKFGDRRWIDVSFFPVQANPPAAINEQLLETLRLIRGKHVCGALTLPEADLERTNAAIATAEAEKAKGGV